MYRELSYPILVGLLLVGARAITVQAASLAGPIYPRSGAVHVPQRVTLKWVPSPQAAQYDVYLGDSARVVRGANRRTKGVYRGKPQRETTCPLGPLEWGRTYFWRVDAINERDPDSPPKGAVWSFTTANFLTVDDFEKYASDQKGGTAISEFWRVVQGENNVGQIPYADQTVVFTGRRSMPLRYDNTGGVEASVVERTFERSLDLSSGKIDSIVLFVHGRRENAAARLFISLDDGTRPRAVSVHRDREILTKPRWSAWRIPLAELAPGMNLAAVRRMRIGVGDPTRALVAGGDEIRSRLTPAPGPDGTVYIDQIVAAGPTFGVLMGTVKSKQGAPISGATVTLGPLGFRNWPSTSSDGLYAVLLMKGLKYQISVTAPQFQPHTENWPPLGPVTQTVNEKLFVLSP